MGGSTSTVRVCSTGFRQALPTDATGRAREGPRGPGGSPEPRPNPLPACRSGPDEEREGGFAHGVAIHTYERAGAIRYGSFAVDEQGGASALWT
jgi:hypothetical protein